jgi:RNA polymerase sigma-70 factor (sigma-E family)
VDDDEDFRDFVRTRGPALSRAAYLLTGDHHLAEDLLQTVLATTYQHWPRVRRGHPDAYVRRALHNTHISCWRRRGVEPAALSTEALAELAEPGDRTERTLRRLTVVAALRTLTPRQRVVVVLRYFEDLTEAQTADLLGCTIGTVDEVIVHFGQIDILVNNAGIGAAGTIADNPDDEWLRVLRQRGRDRPGHPGRAAPPAPLGRGGGGMAGPRLRPRPDGPRPDATRADPS